jgi:copper chaperone CopZ
MKELKIKVKGMHCHSCEMLITDELAELSGVKGAKASFKDGLVTMQTEDSVDEGKIKAKIKELGYEVI